MKAFDQFLDGESLHRRQGQQGKYPPHWTETEIRHYIKFDALSDLRFNKNTQIAQRLWHYYESEQQQYWDLLEDYQSYYDRMHEKKLEEMMTNYNKKHAGHELGAREFTLTYSPNWMTDREAREKMSLAIKRLIKYLKDEIIEFRAVGEVGSNGLSHIHGFYKLVGGKKITDKQFIRAYPYWNPKKRTSRTGHEGGHHANVRVESDFRSYMEKDIEDAWFEETIELSDPGLPAASV